MGAKSAKHSLESQTLQQLRKEVDFSEEEIQDWFSEYVSRLPKGETELTRDEFKNVYNTIFYGDATQFSEHVFRTFDRDGNGTVDFKEFLVGLHVSGSSDLETKLRWAFKMYDINGDGSITEGEMKTLVTAIFKMTVATLPEAINTPEKMTQKFFQEFDVNNDGKITWTEFRDGAMRDPVIVNLLECDPNP